MKMMIYLSTSYVLLSVVFSFRSRRYDAASVDVSSSPAAAASSSSAFFALSAFSAINRFRAIHAGSGGGGGGGSGAPGVVALANDACTHRRSIVSSRDRFVMLRSCTSRRSSGMPCSLREGREEKGREGRVGDRRRSVDAGKNP
jgi:hypothetical protein